MRLLVASNRTLCSHRAMQRYHSSYTQAVKQACKAPLCDFSEGTIVRCASTGTIYQFTSGELRGFPDQGIYATYGSPAVQYEDAGTCAKMASCPEGAAMAAANAAPTPGEHGASVW